MKILRVVLKMIIWIAAIVLLAAVIGVICSQRLTVKEYTEALDGVDGDVKIVFLSDLHGREFGNKNAQLVELIKEQNPDIITVTGDIINREADNDEIDRMCAFLRQLSAIAPTYFSIGNHEDDYFAKHGTGMLDDICKMGITVLECEYQDITVNGTTFRLGGMSELAYYGGDGKYDPKAEPFLTEYCDTELPKAMLSHRPETFGFRYALQDWDVDLVLSGHTHGGLVRLPIVGGLFAPIQGMFPYFSYGEYTEYDSKMIITSGLAGYGRFPRMYNPPEIAVVTLTAKG